MPGGAGPLLGSAGHSLPDRVMRPDSARSQSRIGGGIKLGISRRKEFKDGNGESSHGVISEGRMRRWPEFLHSTTFLALVECVDAVSCMYVVARVPSAILRAFVAACICVITKL